MTREEICHALKNIYSPEIMHAEYVAIDAACTELKSGYWKTDEKNNWYCSECGLHYDSWAIDGFKYCPNCGAKMKKKTMTREEAIKMLVNATYSDEWQGNEDLTTANHMAIEALKEPEQKKGKWILSDEQQQEDVDNGNYRFICSECGKSDIHSKAVIVSFCWNCGARMEEGQ